jgi:hypothetical protein
MKLIFNDARMKERSKAFTRKQKYIDSAVLKFSEPYTPKISANLIGSGIRATILGSGEVRYNAPYARRVYYSKRPVGRSNGPLRGNSWFERMKIDKKAIILEEAEKID